MRYILSCMMAQNRTDTSGKFLLYILAFTTCGRTLAWLFVSAMHRFLIQQFWTCICNVCLFVHCLSNCFSVKLLANCDILHNTNDTRFLRLIYIFEIYKNLVIVY